MRIDRKRKQPVTVLLKALGIAETREEILELFGDSECIKRTLEKDYTETREEALIEIYKRLRPGEPPTVESARVAARRPVLQPAALRPGEGRPLQGEHASWV